MSLEVDLGVGAFGVGLVVARDVGEGVGVTTLGEVSGVEVAAGVSLGLDTIAAV